MSEFSDLASSVSKALEMFEWSRQGFSEYVEVTDGVLSLQECLLDHLQEVGRPEDYDSRTAATVVDLLNRFIRQDFERLDGPDYEDEVIAWGEGLAILVDPKGEYGFVSIDSNSRLHGRVSRPIVMEVPVLESVASGGQIQEGAVKPLQQIAVAIELTESSIENISDEPGFMDLPPDERVYLPLYSGIRLKQRVVAN